MTAHGMPAYTIEGQGHVLDMLQASSKDSTRVKNRPNDSAVTEVAVQTVLCGLVSAESGMIQWVEVDDETKALQNLKKKCSHRV